MFSWYVAHVFSEWLWNSPSRPYYYWYHLCFYIPHALYFYCKVFIFSASFLITFLSPEIATSINMHVPFWLTRIIMSGLLLGVVLSVFTLLLLLLLVNIIYLLKYLKPQQSCLKAINIKQKTTHKTTNSTQTQKCLFSGLNEQMTSSKQHNWRQDGWDRWTGR